MRFSEKGPVVFTRRSRGSMAQQKVKNSSTSWNL